MNDMVKDSKRSARGEQNKPPLSHSGGWRFMDPDDPRRKEWRRMIAADCCCENPDIFAESSDVFIDNEDLRLYYAKLRKVGVCGLNGILFDDISDEGFLFYMASCALKERARSRCKMARDTVQTYLSLIVAWGSSVEAIRNSYLENLLKQARACVFLQGLAEATKEDDRNFGQFVRELLYIQVRSFCVNDLNEEEERRLTPFLQFLSETDTGRRVQAELIGTPEKDKEALKLLAIPEVGELFQRMEMKGYCTREGDSYQWSKTISLWGYMVDEVSDAYKLRPTNDNIPWKLFASAFADITPEDIKTAKSVVSKYKANGYDLDELKPRGWEDLQEIIYQL